MLRMPVSAYLVLLVFCHLATAAPLSQDQIIAWPAERVSHHLELTDQTEGLCNPCWQECLHPYSKRPGCKRDCNCNPEAACEDHNDCGEGLFCGSPLDIPAASQLNNTSNTCQACEGCYSDAQAVDGSCAAACPSGSLQQAPLHPYIPASFLFADAVSAYNSSSPAQAALPGLASSAGTVVQRQLLAENRRQQAGLNARAFRAWLADGGSAATGLQADHAFWQMDSNQDGLLSVQEYAAAQVAFDPRELMCDPDFLSVHSVYPGCPCNPEVDAEMGRCPAGWQCTELGFRQLEAAGGLWPAPHHHNASCVPCSFGQFCPEGTYQPAADSPKAIADYVTQHTCRPGSFCPTPDRIYACPPGYFCPAGSVAPVTCSFPELMQQAPQQLLPSTPFSVHMRIYDMGEPLGGNICLDHSTAPTRVCPKGHYCPNTTSELVCPAGSFCKAFSRQPKDCPWLATCPEGSVSADLSLGGFLGLAIILVLLWLIYIIVLSYIRLQQERVIRKQQAREKLRRLAAPLLLHHDPSTLALRAFGPIRPKLSVSFERMHVRLRNGTTILQGVTGRFHHSKVSAVMGPSGAGKSTLLNALLGQMHFGIISGRVTVNGHAIRLSRLRRITGFVPQEDVVHEDLTVRENLAYSAWLRSARHVPHRAKHDVVDDVINVLALNHIQHSVVGSAEKRGISGGQRKRVNIGVELVSRPSLLFADEPTSGLDATAASEIVTALKQMARLGMNIVTVIHQPRYSIFTMFDDVLLLGAGGRTMFQGPSRAALPYFEMLGFPLPPNENPADFCLDVISGCVASKTNASLRPETLYSKWEEEGAAWVQMQPSARFGDTDMIPSRSVRLSPEQLSLIDRHFDEVDRLGTGFLTREAIGIFMENLGLQPSTSDMKHIMAELTGAASGDRAVSRADFIEFIRHGGRLPPPPTPATDARRLSIELDSEASSQGADSSSPLKEAAEADDAPTPSTSDPASAQAQADHSQMNGPGHRPRPSVAASPFANTLPADAESMGASPDNHAAFLARHSLLLEQGSDQLGSSEDARLLSAMSPTASLAELSLAGHSDIEDQQTSKPPLSLAARCNACWQACKGSVIGLCQSQRRPKARYRRVPGFRKQFTLLLRRAGVKWVRNWSLKFVDLLLFAAAALCVGATHGTAWELEHVRGNTVMALLALTVITCVASLQVFGKDRLVFWRESAAGVSTSAFFFAHSTLHLLDILVQPLVFMSLYYTLILPEIAFFDFYIIALLTVWYTSGLSYFISVMLVPQNAMVAVVAITMVIGGFLNGVEPRLRKLSSFMKGVEGLGFSRWATEAMLVEEFKRYDYYMQPRIHLIMAEVGYCGLNDYQDVPSGPDVNEDSLDIHIFCRGYIRRAIFAMVLLGLVFRVLTYLALRFWNRPAGQQQSLLQWCTNVLLGVLRLAHRQVLKLQRRLEPWVADRPLLRSWLPQSAADPHSSASPEGAWATGGLTGQSKNASETGEAGGSSHLAERGSLGALQRPGSLRLPRTSSQELPISRAGTVRGMPSFSRVSQTGDESDPNPAADTGRHEGFGRSKLPARGPVSPLTTPLLPK